VNSNANHREVWLRDPDGYVVVIASAYGDLGSVVTSDRSANKKFGED
jgi:hypothetical protein